MISSRPPRSQPAGSSTPRARKEPAGLKPRSLGRDAWSELIRRPLFLISLVAHRHLPADGGLPTTVHPSKDPRYLRPGPESPATELRGLVRRRQPRVRRVREHHLRGAVLDDRRRSRPRSWSSSSAPSWAPWPASSAASTDTVLSRTADIFFGIPFLLGALLVLTTFPSEPDTPAWKTIGKVVFTLTILGWPPVPAAHAFERDPGAPQRLRRSGEVTGRLRQPR